MQRPKGADKKPAEHTRAEQIERDGGRIELPDAPAYLLTWLHQLGWAEAGPNCPLPLSAQEIHAWASCAGHRLQGWEFLALQAASRAYVDEFLAERATPPDDQDEATLADPNVIDERTARVFDRLSTPVKRKTRRK